MRYLHIHILILQYPQKIIKFEIVLRLKFLLYHPTVNTKCNCTLITIETKKQYPCIGSSNSNLNDDFIRTQIITLSMLCYLYFSSIFSWMVDLIPNHPIILNKFSIDLAISIIYYKIISTPK